MPPVTLVQLQVQMLPFVPQSATDHTTRFVFLSSTIQLFPVTEWKRLLHELYLHTELHVEWRERQGLQVPVASSLLPASFVVCKIIK